MGILPAEWYYLEICLCNRIGPEGFLCAILKTALTRVIVAGEGNSFLVPNVLNCISTSVPT